jgi:ELWxxDGT repeat protein
MVKDITPEGVDVGSDWPQALTAVGNLLYFRANDGIHGQEPWVSDGTSAGTRMLEVEPGPHGSIPGEFEEYNGLAYFSAGTVAAGGELWRTNGTPAGTEMVKDIVPGTGGSNPRYLTVFAGKLYFVKFENGSCGARGVLFRTDGTPDGTKAVIDKNGRRIRGTFQGCAAKALWPIGTNLFIGRNQQEIWRSGGTAATTFKLANFGTRLLVGLGNVGYMSWYKGSEPYPDSTLWRSDGTAIGTVPLYYADATPIQVDPHPYGDLHTLPGTLVFWDWVRGISASDGTSAGTHALDVNVWPGDDEYFEETMATLNSVLYFDGRVSVDGNLSGPALWRTDGTTAGTYAVSPTYGNDLVDGITAMGQSLYFVNSGGGKGVELWRYDP